MFVLRVVVAPATVVLGPAGAFVVLAGGDGSRADLRDHVRAVRTALDGAGLRALPVEGIRGADLSAVVDYAESDVRFGPSVLRRAHLALEPPPFVATVKDAPGVAASAGESVEVVV